ncbi:PREDICTED: psychosine receptor [Gekko japonicus]|uniref:Psychosine receptor n=1 Tax=Gekko japonicus TaxID=146911 RepID=A0ABM1L834_GEKJA|nr:PREDICTED: psychosine receptor [Gekko japonicus]
MATSCDTENCTIEYELDKHLFPALYSILVVISIPTNIASLYVSCCQVKKKNELGIYLFSLSLADLLYTLTLPLWIYYAQNEDNWTLPSHLCTASVFLKYLNYYTSSGFLTCISIDRYLAVVHPMRFHCVRTRRVAFFVTVMVWVFEIVSNSKVLYEQDTFEEPFKGSNHTNHTFCYDTYPLKEWQANFNYYRVCMGFAVPLTIMLFCYQKIYQAVKNNQATEDRDKKKIKNLLLTIVVTFFLCFTPYHIVLLLRSIYEPCDCSFAERMYEPYRITTALTSVNCILDPLLYCFVSEAGRTDVQDMFRGCFSVSPSDVKQSQNIALSSSSQARTGKVPESATFLYNRELNLTNVGEEASFSL